MENNKPKLFVFSGPSGVGKGTILKEFLKKNSFVKYSVSSTTRKPRNTETDGVDYNFVSREDFLLSIQNGDFLEWASYNNNFYGTNKKNVQKMLDDGFSVILEIEVQGAVQVMKKIPDCVSIFVLPPSLDELYNRLKSRNTEDELTILNRLKIAEIEIGLKNKFNYSIVNDNLDDALSKLQEIYLKEIQ